MSKNKFFLISFVLVLGLVSNIFAAYDEVHWDNQNGAGNQLWQTALNWTLKAGGPAQHEVPTSDDWVVIDKYADEANGPIINSSSNAVCNWIDMGYYLSPAEESVLTMTGGTLTIGNYFYIGRGKSGNYRFDISAGTVNAGTGGYDLYVGNTGSSVGTVNMTGGTILVGQDIEMGNYNTGCGIINMSGGYIELLTENQIYVGFYSPNPSIFNITGGEVHTYEFVVGNNWGDLPAGAGHLKLHGGTIYTEYFAFGGASTIDVTDGVLIADEDLTVPNGYMFNPGVDTHTIQPWTGTLPILIEKGLINAYDVNNGEIITDDVNYPAEAGLRAVVMVNYGVTNPGKTTLSAAAIDPNLAWNENPTSGKTWQPLVITLRWSAGNNATAHDVYFGNSFAEVNSATNPYVVPGRGRQALAVNSYSPAALALNTTYYWRIDEVNASGIPQWKGTVWNFRTIPGVATAPYPADGAEDVRPDVVLHWTQGSGAVKHEVYFGTGWAEVNDANKSSSEYKGEQLYGANTYNAGALQNLKLNTDYYWRIDEVNLAAGVIRWKGDVWSFTVAESLAVDDFDSYATDEDLGNVWTDAYIIPALNALVYVETGALNEDLVHDGNSMEYIYKNQATGGGTKNRYSEAYAMASQLNSGTNWNIGGAKALVLYFYGKPLNSADPVRDRMWVALSDGTHTGVVKYPDMNDIKEKFWHEWDIALNDPCLASVNKSIISKISIGFGVRGGSTTNGGTGTVYFDDIELWPPWCRTEFVAADVSGDCVTDLEDVEVMSEDWLVGDYNGIAALPPDANLLGHWNFNEGTGKIAADSSAYDNDGNYMGLHGTPTWVGGYPGDPCGKAINFDPFWQDYMLCAERDGCSPGIYPAELMPSTFTISCWTKLDLFTWFGSFVTNGIDTGDDECGFFLYNWGWEGESGQDFGLVIVTESDGLTYVETPNIYETKRWYHLAATYDGNYVNIYVDGLLSTGPVDVGGPMRWISADSNNYPGNFVIGSWEDVGYSLPVDGTIDDVRYYNYALSQGEISVLAGLVAPGSEYYQPVPSPANIIDPEAKLSRKVNFRDYAVLAAHWLEGPILWP